MTENDSSRNNSYPPPRRFTFDRNIQIGGVLAVVVALGVATRDIYKDFQDQLYALKMTDVTTQQKIDALTYDMKLVRDVIVQVKSDQKETDNALRKSLESITEDIHKIQLSIAGRGRTQLFCSPNDGGNCWTDRRYIPIGADCSWPQYEGIESIPITSSKPRE